MSQKKKLTDQNHDKYNTPPEFNTFAVDIFNARLAQANLIAKTDFDATLSSLNRKISANKSKHLLVENKLKKLKTFDSSYFIGKSHFEEEGTQNYLVFLPMNRYFKFIANTKYISSWKSKGLSNKSIKPPATSDNSLAPLVDYLGSKIRLKFNGSCLKQHNLTYTHSIVVNIYIIYEIAASGSNSDDLTVRNSLLIVFRLTKNTDIDKHGYSGYGIAFERRRSFSFPGGVFGNVITFGVDMNSSAQVDNKKNNISILGNGSAQGLEHKLAAEMYSINFTVTKINFV